jgi:hypothetical protein
VRDAPARPSPTSMVVKSVLTLTLPRCPDFSNALERQRGSWQVAAPAPPPEAAMLSSRGSSGGLRTSLLEPLLFGGNLTRIMSDQRTRRFPAPWTAEQIPGGYVVKDATGQALAYVYGREDKGSADTAKVLTMDEARRVASNIAKLPNYLAANPDSTSE